MFVFFILSCVSLSFLVQTSHSAIPSLFASPPPPTTSLICSPSPPFLIDNCIIPRFAFIHVRESLTPILSPLSLSPSSFLIPHILSPSSPFLPISVSFRHQGFPSSLVTLASRVLSWHGASGVQRRPGSHLWPEEGDWREHITCGITRELA